MDKVDETLVDVFDRIYNSLIDAIIEYDYEDTILRDTIKEEYKAQTMIYVLENIGCVWSLYGSLSDELIESAILDAYIDVITK